MEPPYKPLSPVLDAASQKLPEGASADSGCRVIVPIAADDYPGGLVCCNEMAEQLRSVGVSMAVSLVARWIIARDVLNTKRYSRILLPLFQFDLATMAPSHTVYRVLIELRDVLDDEQLCDWFSTPNSWLAGAMPVYALARDPCGVFEAARADRYVIRG